jgi:hypothetical protein
MTNYPFGKILPKEIDLPATGGFFIYSSADALQVTPCLFLIADLNKKPHASS